MPNEPSTPEPPDSHILARYARPMVRERLHALLLSRRDPIAAEVAHNPAISVSSEYPVFERRQFAERAINAYLEILSKGSTRAVDALAAEVAGPGTWAAADIQQALSGVARAVYPALGVAVQDDFQLLVECLTALAACAEIATVRAAKTLETLVTSEIQAADERQRQFYREVTTLATRNRLRLVASDYEMPPASGEAIRLEDASDAARLRHRAQEAAVGLQMDAELARDLALAVGEAAANAIAHAGRGRAHVWCDERTVFVKVRDFGGGIDILDLPRATLAPGWSSEVSLGMGFTLMLEMADVLWLATSGEGTTICIEKSVSPQQDPAMEFVLQTFPVT